MDDWSYKQVQHYVAMQEISGNVSTENLAGVKQIILNIPMGRYMEMVEGDGPQEDMLIYYTRYVVKEILFLSTN